MVAIHASASGDVWMPPTRPGAPRERHVRNRLALPRAAPRACCVLAPLAGGGYMVSAFFGD